MTSGGKLGGLGQGVEPGMGQPSCVPVQRQQHGQRLGAVNVVVNHQYTQRRWRALLRLRVWHSGFGDGHGERQTDGERACGADASALRFYGAVMHFH